MIHFKQINRDSFLSLWSLDQENFSRENCKEERSLIICCLSKLATTADAAAVSSISPLKLIDCQCRVWLVGKQNKD